MKLEEYLKEELNISTKEAIRIAETVNKYKKKKEKKKLNIKIPNYTLKEEIINAISHGIGGALAILALVLLVIKANGVLKETTVTLFGSTMIILYTMSCIYHALSPNLEGKKVLRVIDHCNVYLLVYGTYIPISLVGIGGTYGMVMFLIITAITITGITLTSVKIDKTQVLQVICHLISGWSVLFAVSPLIKNLGTTGFLFLILGGVMYSIGSILYGIGSKKRYMHSVFHIFCLLGTLFHFLCIYLYVI